MTFTQDKDLLRLCRHLWDGMEPFRARRRTALDFAYGRHWRREYTLPDGRITTPEKEMQARGKRPITNNLTRQLIKTVVGKWRYLRSRHTCGDSDDGHTLSRAIDGDTLRDLADARALEEFLISGCVAQRVDDDGEAVNISPARLFFSSFSREDASDCRLAGILHDMAPSEVLRRFSEGDTTRFTALARLISTRCRTMGIAPFAEHAEVSFGYPSQAGCMRVIEVWTQRPVALLRLHDPESAAYVVTEADEELCRRLVEINRRRAHDGKEGVRAIPDVTDVWEHTWLTPDGYVLRREVLPEGVQPPLAVRCYPMIDGEIHSLVEDVISQQEYVNRLVQLLDETIEHAAKGVLLYPTDQLPHGMTWEQLRRIWSTPGAIIPFRRNSKNITPVQITSPRTSAGASEMLRTQLDLFGRISGTSFSTERHGINANSADMLRRQMENEMVALLDILSSFEAFVARRDMIAGKEAAHA